MAVRMRKQQIAGSDKMLGNNFWINISHSSGHRTSALGTWDSGVKSSVEERHYQIFPACFGTDFPKPLWLSQFEMFPGKSVLQICN